MADMLANGVTWLADQRSEHLAQTVTLVIDGKSATGVKATKCPVRADSDPTVNVDINHSDWIIQASLYLYNGDSVKPKKNDVIEEADGQRWKVSPLDNEPEARHSDQFGNAWRIHTKRTSEAD